MDRRQAKTRNAIFKAFSKLLETNRYNHITVQKIIDEANIGRSTFYAHFETKDALVEAMCSDIFHHVFSHELISEKTHDFSNTPNGLEEKITHLLYHLKDMEKDITGMLSCEDGALFMGYFKQYLRKLFLPYMDHISTFIEAPSEFILNYLIGSFSEAILLWVSGNMAQSPEELSKIYMALIRI